MQQQQHRVIYAKFNDLTQLLKVHEFTVQKREKKIGMTECILISSLSLSLSDSRVQSWLSKHINFDTCVIRWQSAHALSICKCLWWENLPGEFNQFGWELCVNYASTQQSLPPLQNYWHMYRHGWLGVKYQFSMRWHRSQQKTNKTETSRRRMGTAHCNNKTQSHFPFPCNEAEKAQSALG